MTEMLWSDPGPNAGLLPSKRGVGVAFGQDVTERFLRDNDLELLIRWSQRAAGQGIEARAGGLPRAGGVGVRGWRLSF
jgi:serine/threonine-protein phosphatase 5